MSNEALEVAENLLRNASGEAEYRAAASRAYMAAFQHIMHHRELKNFTPGKTSEDHRLLIEYLKTSADPKLKKLGYGYLPRLRSLRNRADYTLDMPFTKGLAKEALEMATDIIFDFLPS